MEKITVSVARPYDVIVERGGAAMAGELIGEVKSPCRVLLVSDDNVYPIYGEKVTESLSRAGFKVSSFVIEHGEASKNPAVLFSILEKAAEESITRSDLFVALGGGVVGDITGLSAALFLRGVDYVGIPTSLLSMVDSSVGGKTAVDLPSGKNLVGAFHQPIRVICDPDTLATLPEYYFADGSAEVVKYGMIADSEILSMIVSSGVENNIEELILRSVKIKRDIVERDEFDRGDRKLLNFGHTVGHAVEIAAEFSVSHGRGVAYGMTAITAAAEKLGLASGCSGILKKALEAAGLDNSLPPYSGDELIDTMLRDKKREGDSITLVIPSEPGKCVLHGLPVSQLRELLFGEGRA